jgi:hypothetical protein
MVVTAVLGRFASGELGREGGAWSGCSVLGGGGGGVVAAAPVIAAGSYCLCRLPSTRRQIGLPRGDALIGKRVE